MNLCEQARQTLDAASKDYGCGRAECMSYQLGDNLRHVCHLAKELRKQGVTPDTEVLLAAILEPEPLPP